RAPRPRAALGARRAPRRGGAPALGAGGRGRRDARRRRPAGGGGARGRAGHQPRAGGGRHRRERAAARARVAGGRVPGAHRRHEGGGMTGSIRAELLVLRKRPSTWILLGLWTALALVFAYAVPYATFRDNPVEQPLPE